MATKSASNRNRKNVDVYDTSQITDKDKIFNVLGKKINIKTKNDSQKNLIKLIKSKEVVIVAGSAGTGKTFLTLATALDLIVDKTTPYTHIHLIKSVTTLPNEELGFVKGPQPYYEKILTVNGWKTMGEINKGDFVYGKNGEPIKVLEIFEKGINDVYRITLKDGRFVDCCINHIWNVKTKSLDYFNVDTKFLLNNYEKNKFYLPKIDALNFDKKNIKINPYLMGVLLSDGCISGGHVRFCGIDDEIIERVRKLSEEYDLNLTTNNIIHTLTTSRKVTQSGAKEIKLTNITTGEEIFGYLKDIREFLGLKDTTIIGRCQNNLTIDNYRYEYTGKISGCGNILKQYLIDYNLLGKKSYEKFIPDDYLYSNIEDRVDILNGLLDTDGTIRKSSEIVHNTTSLELANNIKTLVLSLGGSARIYETKPKQYKSRQINGIQIKQMRIMYSIYINFFNENINPFFIKRKAEKFKPKHTESFQIEKIENLNIQEKMKCIKVDSKDSLYITKDFILTHNTLSEKIEMPMLSFMMNIHKLVPEPAILKLVEMGVIKHTPLAYIRGLSIDNAIIILDETQNVTIETLRTLMTRIGENSKLIALGDTKQVDLKQKNKSALKTAMKIFEDVEEIGTMEFTSDDIVRNPLIKIIEEKFNSLENAK
jgi:phosphate starvation-inducible PhoH-like protein